MASYLFAGFATFFAGLLTAVIFFANQMRPAGEFIGRNFIALAWMVVCVLWLIATWPAIAHENGRTDQNWEEMSPEELAWMKGLMQPDSPSVSCCGEADQYWCDKIYVREKKTYCQITDDRDDKRFNRPHIPIGTEIEIPDHKLKWEQDGKPTGNPTGHSIVFVSRALYVFCFVQSTGI
jgi:hypothetical protein